MANWFIHTLKEECTHFHGWRKLEGALDVIGDKADIASACHDFCVRLICVNTLECGMDAGERARDWVWLTLENRAVTRSPVELGMPMPAS